MEAKTLSTPKSRTNILAIATLSLALLAVSFAPIFIRLSETELGPNATVLNRMAIFFVLFGMAKFISARLSTTEEKSELQLGEAEPQPAVTPEEMPHDAWLLLFGMGLISIISLVLWAISLQYTTVAKCMLLNNLTPIFTSLGSWLLFGKKFDRQFLIGMAIALTGAIGLGFEDFTSSDGLLIGDIYALFSAVFLGTYFLMVEQLRNRFDATTILLWRCGVGSAILIPLTVFTEGQLLPTTTLAIGAVLGLGIICEGFGQRLIAASMDTLSSSFVSLFLLLEPIISAILAWFIFSEALGFTTWLGFAVVLSGICLSQQSQSAAHGA